MEQGKDAYDQYNARPLKSSTKRRQGLVSAVNFFDSALTQYRNFEEPKPALLIVILFTYAYVLFQRSHRFPDFGFDLVKVIELHEEAVNLLESLPDPEETLTEEEHLLLLSPYRYFIPYYLSLPRATFSNAYARKPIISYQSALFLSLADGYFSHYFNFKNQEAFDKAIQTYDALFSKLKGKGERALQSICVTRKATALIIQAESRSGEARKEILRQVIDLLQEANLELASWHELEVSGKVRQHPGTHARSFQEQYFLTLGKAHSLFLDPVDESKRSGDNENMESEIFHLDAAIEYVRKAIKTAPDTAPEIFDNGINHSYRLAELGQQLIRKRDYLQVANSHPESTQLSNESTQPQLDERNALSREAKECGILGLILLGENISQDYPDLHERLYALSQIP